MLALISPEAPSNGWNGHGRRCQGTSMWTARHRVSPCELARAPPPSPSTETRRYLPSPKLPSSSPLHAALPLPPRAHAAALMRAVPPPARVAGDLPEPGQSHFPSSPFLPCAAEPPPRTPCARRHGHQEVEDDPGKRKK